MYVKRILWVSGWVLMSAVGASWAEEKPTEVDPSAKERLQLAREGYEAALDRTVKKLMAPPTEGDTPPSEWMDGERAEEFCTWSKRWSEAERDMNPGEAGLVTALKGHLDRLKTLERGQIHQEWMRRLGRTSTEREAVEHSTLLDDFNKRIKFHRLEAESWLWKQAAKKRNG